MLVFWHVVPSVDYFLDELIVAQVGVRLAHPEQERIAVERIRRVVRFDKLAILLRLVSWLLAFGFGSTHQAGERRAGRRWTAAQAQSIHNPIEKAELKGATATCCGDQTI